MLFGKLKNVKQTEANKKELLDKSLILGLMLEDGREVITKQELQEIFNLKERQARNEIALISLFYPVIAHSDNKTKGYRLAKKIDDLTTEDLNKEIREVEYQINETQSRIKCLKKRLKPLIAYYNVAIKELNKRSVEEERS